MRTTLALVVLSSAAVVPAQAGSLDASFGAGGVVVGGSADTYRQVLVQPDGRIVVVGFRAAANGNQSWLVQRFLADGSADGGFATGGTALLFGTGPEDRAFDAALDAQGRLLVAGQSRHGTGNSAHGDLTVVRLTGSGAPDPTFGSQGVVRLHASASSRSESSAVAVAVQADGRVVAGGYAIGKKNGYDLCLVRLSASGTLDGTFGTGGIVLDVLGTGTSLDWPAERSLVIQSDGRILFAGAAYWGTTNWFENAWNLVRYLPDGSRDASWGSGGRVTGGFAGYSKAWLHGVAVDAGGLVTASGRAFHDVGSSGFDVFSARYLANGALDPGFGNGGSVGSDVDGDDQSQGLALDAAGRIVQAVGFDGYGVVSRQTPTGALDATFGIGGLSAPTPFANVLPRAVAIDASGRILIVLEGAVVARYLGS